MVRHVSIFFLKEDNKEKNKMQILAWLGEMENRLSDVTEYKFGADNSLKPPKGIPGLPEFGDILQVIDFTTEEAARGYADSEAHIQFVKKSEAMIEKVVAINVKL